MRPPPRPEPGDAKRRRFDSGDGRLAGCAHRRRTGPGGGRRRAGCAAGGYRRRRTRAAPRDTDDLRARRYVVPDELTLLTPPRRWLVARDPEHGDAQREYQEDQYQHHNHDQGQVDVADDHAGGGHAPALLAGPLDLVAGHVSGDHGNQRDGESARSGYDVSEERGDARHQADYRQRVRLAGSGSGRRTSGYAWHGAW